MPSFAYSARDVRGQLMEGVLEAASAAAVADQLMGGGMTPLKIAASAELVATAAAPALKLSFGRGAKVQHEDLLMFSRQLHSLLKAGIPITRALSGLQESASEAMSKVIRGVRESLESGIELSTSMARQNGIFNNFYVAMIRVGELTGRLDEVFLRLFHHQEFEKLMRDQVKTALRYPSFVIAVMAVAVAVINLFVIPAFQKVFDGFGAQLPLVTRPP
jgi:MSHA biogenesis protein MshG